MGSSTVNLSSRLSDYFSMAYIRAQLARGKSSICSALDKYGHANFSVQVLPCDDPLTEEQYYLDNYKVEYNIRRTATGPAPGAQQDITGSKNPQYGQVGPKAAHWGHTHLTERIELWSLSRSIQYYLYSVVSATLFITCLGLARLADFLGVHVNTARRAVASKLYKGYILSTSLLTIPELQTAILASQPPINRRIAKKVYIYNEGRNVLLHCCETVTNFMGLSGLSGSAVRTLCLSTTSL